MERYSFRFDFPELNLDVHKIGQLVDYDKGGNTEMIAEMIKEVLEESAGMCEIKAEYAVWPSVEVIKETESVVINNINFSVGKIVRPQLRKCDSIAVFLCTAGEKIGTHARRLIGDKDFLKGYLFDMAGSEIVEAAADIMQEAVRRYAESHGKHITNRYSPGYCGWHVSEQQKLFKLIPDNFCGIKLNESSLMEPIKSVSGFIGIGEHVKYNPYTCSICDQKDCIYRNHRSS
jgi:cobalamin-dependent methionine synthase I